MKKTNLFSRPMLVAALAALASACSPIVEVRGNVPDPEQLAQVKVGTSTREDVQALLGTPSSVTAFNDQNWYYISAVTEREAFFAPETKERKVVGIIFDQMGKVRAIDTLGLEDSKDVVPNTRETPTAGKELTILQQLMGNVGRFNTKEK